MAADMIAPPLELTDPPPAQDGRTTDPVDEILSAIHLSGGVVVTSDFRGDWAITTSFEPDSCARFFPVMGPLMAYHYVREGGCWASVPGQEPIFASEGSIIVLPRNDAHNLYTADLPPILADELLDVSDPSMLRISHGDSGPSTRLFCGFLSSSEPDTPLLDRLPALLVIPPANEAQAEWVGTSMSMATSSVGMPAADVARLTELLVRATLRDHLRTIAKEHHGWLDGLRDRHVARCLSLIHRHFAEPIDMAWLSREVGLSRSALHERFVDILGEPPMHYCMRWRLRHAADLLRDTGANTASVAYAAGYNSEAAFNRAFKREYGEPPAAWRRRKAEAMTPGPGLTAQPVRNAAIA
jgi:AraC-like DNA-binding protein